jgi:hypothetical protein
MNPKDNKPHKIRIRGAERIMQDKNWMKKTIVVVAITLIFILPGATTFANKNEQRTLSPLSEPGFILAWGDNTYGERDVPSPNSGFTAIAANLDYSLGLKEDGSIVVWGAFTVPSPNSGFTAVAAGWYHSLGLKENGSIVAWGDNFYGQCNVPSPNSGFTAISAGGYHSLGLKADGSIVSWGFNGEGQCTVPSPNSGFTAIAAGYTHSLGLKADGSIVAWGWNYYGECNVPSPNSGFTAIAASTGGQHSMGLKTDGSIRAWGENDYGQCNVPLPNSGFTAISAGGYHSLGLKADDSIVAWGANWFGQCTVPSPNSGFVAVAAGWLHSLGLKVGVPPNIPPNTPNVPSGPTPLNPGESGVYTTLTTDPDGDQVQYMFDWNATGSHEYSGWTNLVPSGQFASLSHSWSNAGTYVVKAKARDEHAAESGWSDGLIVIVNQIEITNLALFGIGLDDSLLQKSYIYPVFFRGESPVGIIVSLSQPIQSLTSPTVVLNIYNSTNKLCGTVELTAKDYSQFYPPNQLYTQWNWNGTDPEKLPVGIYRLDADLYNNDNIVSQMSTNFYVIFNRPSGINDNDYSWYLSDQSRQLQYPYLPYGLGNKDYILHKSKPKIWLEALTNSKWGVNGVINRTTALENLSALACSKAKYNDDLFGPHHWWDTLTFLDEKTGACSDYAALMTAYARAIGIPARVLDGYYSEWDTGLHGHSWVEGWTGWNTINNDTAGGYWKSYNPTNLSRDSSAEGYFNKYQPLVLGRKMKPLPLYFAQTIKDSSDGTIDRMRDCALSFDLISHEESGSQLKVTLKNTAHIKNMLQNGNQGYLYLVCYFQDKTCEFPAFKYTTPIDMEVNGTINVDETRLFYIPLPSDSFPHPWICYLSVKHYTTHTPDDSMPHYTVDSYPSFDVQGTGSFLKQNKMNHQMSTGNFFNITQSVNVNGKTIPLDNLTISTINSSGDNLSINTEYWYPDNYSFLFKQNTNINDSLQYIRDFYTIENRYNDSQTFTLKMPYYLNGDTAYIPGYGTVATNMELNISADYLVLYNSTSGTNGNVTVLTFSRDTIIKNISFSEYPDGEPIARVIVSWDYKLNTLGSCQTDAYMMTIEGNGQGFSEIYGNVTQEIYSKGDSLVSLDLTAPANLKSGNILPVNLSISNNGNQNETTAIMLNITKVIPSIPPSVAPLYENETTITVSPQSNMTIHYDVMTNGNSTPWRLFTQAMTDKNVKAVSTSSMDHCFAIEFNTPEAVDQNVAFPFNVTITNTWDTVIHNATVELNRFHCFNVVQAPGQTSFDLQPFESKTLNWTLSTNSSDKLPIEIQIGSDNGGSCEKTTKITALSPPYLTLDYVTPVFEQNTPFNITFIITNAGNHVSHNTSLTLLLPENVTIDNATKFLGNITPHENVNVSWEVTANVNNSIVILLNVTSDEEQKEEYIFTIIERPPDTPNNPYPMNDATGISVTADLNWTGGDPDQGDTVTYDVYFGTTNPPPKIISNQSATTYDLGTLTYSTTYYWKIAAWDRLGASTLGPLWNFTTEMDITSPVTTISLNGTLGNNGWYTSSVIVTLNATDSQSGVNYTKYKIDNDGWSIYTGPFVISGDGEHVISYYSVDTIGNVEITKSANLSIDTTAPLTTHTFSGTMGYNNWYISNVTIALTATDTDSGINNTYYQVDNASWNTYTSPFVVTTDNSHTLKYYSIDNAGNIESVKGPFTFKIDKTKPATSHIFSGTAGSNGWFISNVTITLTATDAGSGVNHTYYQVDSGSWNIYASPFVVTADGSHTLKYYSVDNAGNTESEKGPFNFKIDKTKPVTNHAFSGTMGDNSWYISNVTVTLTAADAGSGVNHTYYQVDSGSWNTYASPFVVTADGSHTLKYYSVDQAGNTETIKSTNLNIDTTAPITTHVLSGTIGKNNWYTSNVTFTLTATDPSPPKKTVPMLTLNTSRGPSGINHTYYKIDSGNWVEYNAPVTVSTDGSHNLSYYSVDLAGNTETVKGPFSFKIDQTPPSITLTKQQIDLVDVDFTAQVSDNISGIDRVEFFLDGVLQFNDTQSPYEWRWTGFGNHQVIATVYDLAGNSKSQSMSTPLIQLQDSTGMQISQQQMNIIFNKQQGLS